MTPYNASRRQFFRTVLLTGSGLVLGIETSSCSQSVAADFQPNIWLCITNDGRITITLAKSEMGQGVRTALATLVAEELDADWQQIAVIQAETSDRYGSQSTAGSSSIRDLWLPLREAGAAARQMLMQAAAASWQVPIAECSTHNSVVTHTATGRRKKYAELASAARLLTLPSKPALKASTDFKLIGQSLNRIDNVDKVTGRARYGIDQRVPGLKYAAIRQAPVFGATLAEVDESDVLPGVLAVVKLESAVAVVADSWWQAQQAVTALKLRWQGGDNKLNSASMARDYQALLDQPGTVETVTGSLASADNHLHLAADYTASLQAHATMEPMNCTVHIHDGVCDIWAPTQHPQLARDQAKALLQSGVEKVLDKVTELTRFGSNKVRVHTTLLGGGFGRRLEQDYVLQAVAIARQTGLPIQLIWSREEDIQHDFYRPYTAHRLSADLDSRGAIISWRHRIVGPSHGRSTGGADIPYQTGHYLLDYHVQKYAVPIGSWRSVGSSHNAFVTESFIDELAHRAGIDAWQYRRQLLSHAPSVLAVLDQAASLANWREKRPAGKALGLALHHQFGSIVCQVAEVSIVAAKPRVERVFCVVDCGQVVNTGIVKAQLEGGIVFGLTAALQSQITIQAGRVEQSNFHDFALLGIHAMPEIVIHIMPGSGAPGGIGEVGVPPIAAAVANAIFALTGERIRNLPLHLSAARNTNPIG